RRTNALWFLDLRFFGRFYRGAFDATKAHVTAPEARLPPPSRVGDAVDGDLVALPARVVLRAGARGKPVAGAGRAGECTGSVGPGRRETLGRCGRRRHLPSPTGWRGL